MDSQQQQQKSGVRVLVRWMILRDLPEVMAIEETSFEFPWTHDEFVETLRRRNCIGMVAERDDEIVGYMVYEMNRSRIRLLNFAVAPCWRRCGVGSQMVAKLVGKLSAQRRNRITLEVRETNLPAQFFFRAQGFRAVSLLRDFYHDTPEDAYAMVYRYRAHREVFQFQNRITRLAG